MFTIIYRRLQKYSFWLKILGLMLSGLGLVAIFYYTAPNLQLVFLSSILIFFFIWMFFSLFLANKLALLISILASFLLFFKAVDLLTIANVVLLCAFVVLLWLYFRKSKVVKQETENKPQHSTDTLFPKGWPFGVKRKKEI